MEIKKLPEYFPDWIKNLIQECPFTKLKYFETANKHYKKLTSPKKSLFGKIMKANVLKKAWFLMLIWLALAIVDFNCLILI